MQPNDQGNDIKRELENIERVIDLDRRAAGIYPQQPNSQKWALAEFNLGNILLKGFLERRNVDTNEAIQCYRSALEVWTRESNPRRWATTHNNMGNALCARISGDRIENIDEAIRCYGLALQIHTRESNPQDWATTQNNLGGALCARISGDRRENIDKAIECFRLALQVRTRESNPQFWAATHNNMGNALCARISGDPIKNIDEAMECYRLALLVWTRKSTPQDWAMTLNNQGAALWHWISGDRRENIDKAIKCYKRVLQVWTRESNPQEWAMTQNNIGAAFFAQFVGSRRKNIDNAISRYQLALQIRTRESNPQGWAMTLNNLGNALYSQISGDRKHNIESAIECYRLALQIRTRESNPQDWAMTQINMGYAYLSRTAGDPNSNLSNAKLAIENFVKVISLEKNPLLFLKGCHFHTYLYFRIGSVPQIIASCQQGLQAVEYTKSLSTTGLLHSRCLDERNANFASYLMSLHFHQEQYERVLEVFDHNKASLLLSLISEWDENASKLSEEGRMKLEELKSRYRILKYELDWKSGQKEEYEATMEEFRKVKTEIDALVKAVDFGQGQDVLGVSCREMIEFVKKKDVIGIVLFYARNFKRLREGDWSKLLHGICIWNGKVNGYVGGEDLKLVRFYKTKKLFSDGRMLQSKRVSRDQRKEILEYEKKLLENIGRFVSSMLDGVKEDNPGYELPNRLVIVPHYVLNQVPFCAVPIRTGFDGYNGSNPRFLGDVFRGGIWMLPSMSIGVRIDKKKARGQAKNLSECKVVSATCPTLYIREQYKEMMRKEIASRVNSHVHIEDPYPPREKIKMSEDVRECDILQLTCHGGFAGGRNVWSVLCNPSIVLSESGLSFGSREIDLTSEKGRLMYLNMADIWGLNLKECRLVILVACSGGTVNVFSQNDESLSIGTGFLVSGARNVICCPWILSQITAVIMMSRLYKNVCRDGDEEDRMWKLGEHLGEAQRWYRDLGDDESKNLMNEYDPDGIRADNEPFYSWGSFMLVGPPD